MVEKYYHSGICEIIKSLREQILACESFGEDLNDKDWKNEDGVLISSNDAKAIVKKLEDCLP